MMITKNLLILSLSFGVGLASADAFAVDTAEKYFAGKHAEIMQSAKSAKPSEEAEISEIPKGKSWKDSCFLDVFGQKTGLSPAPMAEIAEIKPSESPAEAACDSEGNLECKTLGFGYPINDYSGLNSLRRRMAEARKPKESKPDSVAVLTSEPVDLATEKRSIIGLPILFFFKIGTAELADNLQEINIKAIAEYASANGFSVDITGSADNATGSAVLNDRLALQRSELIAQLLIASGLGKEKITVSSLGGTDSYPQPKANRNCVVRLCQAE